MPGNGIEEGFHNLFKLGNSSQGHHSGWPVLNCSRLAGKPGQVGASVNFNLKNYNAQQLASLRGHGVEQSEYSRNLYVNQINRNAFASANQHSQAMQHQRRLFYDNAGYDQNNLISGGPALLKFQQENDSVGSPTLTTNSERSEITEASTDFCFPKRQQENFSVLQQCLLQYSPMQQSGYDEMQLLQQQVMLKQLQDLQRQQQLQQFADLRQQNYLNTFSTVHKQANNNQFVPLVDGMPLHDVSQAYVNWGQRGASPVQQGTQNRAMFSMGLSPQQLDVSLYGTPVPSGRGNMNQQSPNQMVYQDSVSLLTKMGGQGHKSVMHSMEVSNPFLKDQCNFSQEQISMPQGAFMSHQGFQGKSSGFVPGNVAIRNTEQINASPKNFNGRQERVGWSEMQPKAAQQSQGLVPLDPLEEKILFNMEDNNFSDICSGVFGNNTFDNTNYPNANSFPSLQSGSWSALMQSAVAEASSCDTGMQEEWSGLTFQNTEPSVDNHVSTLIDNDKQHKGWLNNSLPSSTSFSSESMPVMNNSSMTSSFPSFEQSGNQVPEQQKEGIYQDGSPESIQRSPEVTGHWIDRNPQQKPSMEGNQQVRANLHLDVHSAGMVNHVHSFTDNPPIKKEDSHVKNLAALSNSFQSMASSHEVSQLANWNITSGSPGNAGMSLPFNVPLSGTSQRGELPARSYNVWTDLPIRKHSSLNSSSSMDVAGNIFMNLSKLQQIPSEVYNAPQRVGLHHGQEASAKHISEENDSLSDMSHANYLQPKIDETRPADNPDPAKVFIENLSVIHKMQAISNAETDPARSNSKTGIISNIQQIASMMGQKSYEHISTPQHNSFASGETKTLPDVPSSGMVAMGGCHSQSQSNSNNVVSSSIEHGQANLHAAANWFKQVGTFRNGQMLPVYGSGNFASAQFSSAKSSQNLNAHSYVEQVGLAMEDANAGPSKAVATTLTSEQFKSILPSDVMNQNIAPRLKKRKLVILEQLPWRKEVAQCSERHQGISVAEQEWAQASNRLFEKVEDQVEMIVPRPKRRLILTTQLIQQLVRPAPAFAFSADATLHYDSVLYFVARATLGDACSLTYSERTVLPSSSSESDTNPEKLPTSKRTRHQLYSEVVERCIQKAKKLESDLQRLEKAASIADIRLESQDLERVAVINRFATFHSRAQADTFGNSLSTAMPRPIPQRYVTATPLPRNLPEGVQCLSL